MDGTENHQANNAGRNPAPVDMVGLSLFIYIVLYIPGGAGFPPSTVRLFIQ